MSVDKEIIESYITHCVKDSLPKSFTVDRLNVIKNGLSCTLCTNYLASLDAKSHLDQKDFVMDL